MLNPIRRIYPPNPPLIEPQLCTSSRRVPAGDGWLHEIKYDGWRLLCRKEGSNVRLITRGGHDLAAKLPTITKAIQCLPEKSLWLDGELVYLDENGAPDFWALHEAVRSGKQKRVFYQLWDMMWNGTDDLTAVPLIERKAALRKVLRDPPSAIRYTDHFMGDSERFFRAVNDMDLEGIVSKRERSRYYAGTRTRDWLKVKAWRNYTFVVGGLQLNSKGRLEALLVGTQDGSSLRYEGRVEFGLNRLTEEMRPRFESLISKALPFEGEWSSRKRTWLRPEMRIEVQALPKRDGHALRHATLQRVL